jgi:ubiquinol-cytochrome c reductase cytochrome c subunit
MKMKKLLLVLASILLFAVPELRAQNLDNGKRLYLRNGCWECHNYNGSGGRQGVRLSQIKLTAQGFVNYVRKPRQMPPYSAKIMSDQELLDVYAYIKSFPEPPALSSVPILNNLD